MELLRKLTIKTCGDFTKLKIMKALADAKVADGEGIDLLKIAGEVSGATTGQTDKGSYTLLSGLFVGTDMLTGALYQSGKCILPDFVGSAIGAAVLQGGQSAQFALMIGAKRSDTAVTGYEFTVKPLVEMAASSAAQRLMALAGIETPKLAAPVPAADPAPAPAPAADPAPAPAPAADKKAGKGGK